MILDDPTLWRTHPQQANWQVYIHRPDVILSGNVNQASFSYPITSITYDGGSGTPSNVTIDLTIQILSSTGVHKGYLRAKLADSSILQFFPISQAELGIGFADNDQFKVLDDYRLWAKIPQITPLGVVTKDGSYVPQLPPPVAIIKDGWFACEVPNGGDKSYTLDGSFSFPVADGATITDYLWDIKDGTLDSGSLTDDTIEVTFPVGNRWVTLEVLDSLGHSHQARALIAICDNDINPAPYCDVAEIVNTVERGAECGIQLFEDATNILSGTPVIVFAYERYGDTVAFTQGNGVKFCGFTITDALTINPALSGYQVQAVGPKAFTESLPAFSTTVERIAGPDVTDWFTMPGLTAFRYIHHILQWHSNLLDLFPLELPTWFDEYPALRLKCNEGSLFSQIEFLVEGMWIKFTASARGELYLRKFPPTMSSSERAALDTIVTLEDSDWVEGLTIGTNFLKAVNTIRAMAIVASTSTITVVAAVAPGGVPGQGSTSEQINEGLVLTQAELNSRIGKLYGHRNSGDQQLTIIIVNGGGVNDPAWQELIKFNMEVVNKRGVVFVNKEFITLSVSIQFNAQLGYTLETWEVLPLVSVNTPDALTQQLPGAEPPEGDLPYFTSDGFLLDPLEFPPYIGPTWNDAPAIPYEQTMPNQEPYIPDELKPTSSNIILVNAKVQRLKAGDNWGNYYTAKEIFSFAYGSGSNGWLLARDQLLYVSKFGTSTPMIQAKALLEGYSLLRPLSGVANNMGIAGYGYPIEEWEHEFDFRVDDYDQFITNYLDPSSPDPTAEWELGTGYKAVDWPFTSGPDTYANLYGPIWTYGLEYPFTITFVSMTTYGEGFASNGGSAVGIERNDGNQGYIATLIQENNTLVSGVEKTISWSGELLVQGITFGVYYGTKIVPPGPDGFGQIRKVVIRGKGFDPFSPHRVFTSLNRGEILNQTTLGAGNPHQGFDTDDYNLGIWLAASDNEIFWVDTYTNTTPDGSFDSGDLAGLGALTTVIRIPKLKVSDQSANDSPTSLEFIFGSASPVSGETLWLVDANISTGAINSVTDITPIISGDTYAVIGYRALETFGDNSELIAALAQNLDDDTIHLITSDDGGVTWLDRGELECEHIHFVQPNRGGDGTNLLATGTAGVFAITDFGVTIEDITGNSSDNRKEIFNL